MAQNFASIKTVNKFVPENYELTDENKKAQKEGYFNLVYGSDEIEVMISYMVEWNMGLLLIDKSKG